MSPEDLEEARRAVTTLMGDADIPPAAQLPVWALLDHIAALEAENAALKQTLGPTAQENMRLRAWNIDARGIVQRVAHIGYDAFGHKAEGGPYSFKCPFCLRNIGAPNAMGPYAEGPITHADDCEVLKARALDAIADPQG